ncbi:MAG: hypothetical protein CMM70_07700 [Rhodospirillaceae bacterium]|nr:hypothetical protein [Rhodospirillaceae bacterium]
MDTAGGLSISLVMPHIPTMDITPHIRESRVIIDGYGDGGFRVNGDRRDGALIVLEDHAVSIAATDLESLTLEMLQPLFDAADSLDVVIFGMGERMAFIPVNISQKLQALNIGSDPMDTGAACRCFNVLVTEDRRAAAVLLPV